MNQKRDYYEVLGVGHEATDQEIKSAYRKLALQHHPDRNLNDKETAEEKFKEITEGSQVHYKKADARDPDPEIQAGDVMNQGQLRRIK